jgi:hypothetical protein
VVNFLDMQEYLKEKKFGFILNNADFNSLYYISACLEPISFFNFSIYFRT